MSNSIGIDQRHLLRLHRMLEHVLHQGGYTLTIRQLSILLSCFLDGQHRTLRDLAASVGSAKPAVSRMVEHLIEQGLIERRSDPRDRRSVLFVHTPAGHCLLREIAAAGDRACPKGWS